MTAEADEAEVVVTVEPEPEDETVDEHDETRAKLMSIAKEADTFGNFLAKAMKQVPGVEDGPLAPELLDESGGIWSKR